MKIYLDDNAADPRLQSHLQAAGHTVIRPHDVSLDGASDARHFTQAIESSMVILTADRDDFWELHQLVISAQGKHHGIALVRFDKDPKKDMKPKHVAAAIANLEGAAFDLVNQIVVLNQWR